MSGTAWCTQQTGRQKGSAGNQTDSGQTTTAGHTLIDSIKSIINQTNWEATEWACLQWELRVDTQRWLFCWCSRLSSARWQIKTRQGGPKIILCCSKPHQQPQLTFSSADACCESGQEHPPCSAWIHAWVLSAGYFWKHVQVSSHVRLPSQTRLPALPLQPSALLRRCPTLIGLNSLKAELQAKSIPVVWHRFSQRLRSSMGSGHESIHLVPSKSKASSVIGWSCPANIKACWFTTSAFEAITMLCGCLVDANIW